MIRWALDIIGARDGKEISLTEKVIWYHIFHTIFIFRGYVINFFFDKLLQPLCMDIVIYFLSAECVMKFERLGGCPQYGKVKIENGILDVHGLSECDTACLKKWVHLSLLFKRVHVYPFQLANELIPAAFILLNFGKILFCISLTYVIEISMSYWNLHF